MPGRSTPGICVSVLYCVYSLQRPDPIDYPDNPTPDPTGKPFCLAFLFGEWSRDKGNAINL